MNRTKFTTQGNTLSLPVIVVTTNEIIPDTPADLDIEDTEVVGVALSQHAAEELAAHCLNEKWDEVDHTNADDHEYAQRMLDEVRIGYEKTELVIGALDPLRVG